MFWRAVILITALFAGWAIAAAVDAHERPNMIACVTPLATIQMERVLKKQGEDKAFTFAQKIPSDYVITLWLNPNKAGWSLIMNNVKLGMSCFLGAGNKNGRWKDERLTL
jgi:hypothetical protein